MADNLTETSGTGENRREPQGTVENYRKLGEEQRTLEIRG